MCCFSRTVAGVSGTQIFARHAGGGRQALAYAMNVELDEAVAMVLPLPVVRGAGGAVAEDAVGFVDLSPYPRLFADLARAFPEPQASRGPMLAASRGGGPTLAVHQVGSFEASFVPARTDFARLDPRFRLPPVLFEARPAYDDWSFAVFQLAPGHGRPRRWWWPWSSAASRAQAIHPMALTFPSREPDALFFPTVHVHDGTVPARAGFDHTLYAQVDGEGCALGRTLAWESSGQAVSRWVDAARTAGLVDGAQPVRRRRYGGRLRNVDLWLRPVPHRRPLAAEGACWRWQLQAPSAHGTELYDDEPRREVVTMRGKADALHDAIASGVPALVEAHGGAWGLGPRAGAAVFHRRILAPDGLVDQLGDRPGAPRPCRIAVEVEVDGVDRQEVELGFVAPPARATMTAIERELQALVRRAVA
ncbi:MAG: hypothetical protein HS111_09680 [Kofleriaceae bacterium]|nr:hypothetical protein [Kofleriaceae bacterium]MCL4224952.1 hypothetical protein [Myxococcales bacterium]